ncbi:SRPBCC family protein [Actinosynnema pretiosum subsp. pretiosum]|uniref:SRPBCC family protein n=1 Tax=Actinosynnema pretiosum subsp. pretiosum TaxID=103721 RepID=A0AA45L663_9PSEU|nr:hypothetical protein APASM_4320 [Actinosynnema pretiosum subsp. pretiosum]QUF04299.1 SRPBCC family protein [Actinosynnema pretiosum subsp. pretiosum]
MTTTRVRSDDDPTGSLDLADFAFTRAAWLPAPVERVYALVSDVSLIDRWSPTASGVRYDDGAGPEPGAWFGGHNRRGEREWASRSQVLAASPPEEFSFVVGGVAEGSVRWRWTFRADGGGTIARQEWELLRPHPAFGPTRRDVAALRATMSASAETTLLALSRWLHENPEA